MPEIDPKTRENYEKIIEQLIAQAIQCHTDKVRCRDRSHAMPRQQNTLIQQRAKPITYLLSKRYQLSNLTLTARRKSRVTFTSDRGLRRLFFRILQRPRRFVSRNLRIASAIHVPFRPHPWARGSR